MFTILYISSVTLALVITPSPLYVHYSIIYLFCYRAQLQYTVLSHSAEAVTSDYFFVSCDFIETGEEWTYSNSCTS